MTSVSLNAGWDSRRNVRLYRDLVSPATDFDDTYRQGYWGGVEWRPKGKWMWAEASAATSMSGSSSVANSRVVADVKVAYYDYWYYDKAIRTTQENRDLLTKLSQIAEARYRVGKGMQADVLRSQVEISMLLQKLTTLEQQRATAQARLNTLMARDPDAQPADRDLGAPRHWASSLWCPPSPTQASPGTRYWRRAARGGPRWPPPRLGLQP